MTRLAEYYEENDDRVDPVKYYEMAIDHNGGIPAIINLALYYSRTKNYVKMFGYYVIALDEQNNEQNIDVVHELYQILTTNSEEMKIQIGTYYLGTSHQITELYRKFVEIREQNIDSKYKPDGFEDKYGTSKFQDIGSDHLSVAFISRWLVENEIMVIDDNLISAYELAAEHGCIEAMCRLAGYHEEIEDHQNVLKYYHMAINHSYYDAILDLADYYFNTDDTDTAIKLYRTAATEGEVHVKIEALMTLAAYYEHVDASQAIEFYQQAIDLNHLDAAQLFGMVI